MAVETEKTEQQLLSELALLEEQRKEVSISENTAPLFCNHFYHTLRVISMQTISNFEAFALINKQIV
jgi:hypothetical protein